MRVASVLFLLLVACGTPMPGTDGGADAGSVVVDAGPTDCQEPYRRCDAEFRFRALDETSVQLRGDFAPEGWTVGVPMKKEGTEWVARVSVGFGSNVEYKFLINNSIWVTDPANSILSGGGNSVRQNVRCEVFTCEPNAPQAGAFDWRDSVMAFVFVDRFFDGDPSNNCSVPGADPAGQYQGGDWKGVTQKINAGYFGQLGVNTLWLTVPVKNATVGGRGGDGRLYSAFHGYWPIDLEQYESCFGSKQDLIDLVTAAHAAKLQVLFDFAMVHVHSSSALYAQHPDWFWPLAFNGGQCVCDDGSVCTWNAQGQRCWFTDYLPHWNYTVPAAREYTVRQATRLLEETGADGFRLDAIKHVDNSWLLALRTEVEKVAATRTPRPRMYFVGETFDFGNRDYLKSFVDPKTKLDGQFDFPLRLQVLESIITRRAPMSALRDFVGTNDSFYGPNTLMSPWIGNHDLGRVIHMAEDTPLWGAYDDGKGRAFNNPPTLPGYRRPFERIANAYVFLLTSPGVPLLYYGDEIGLPGAGDPDNRRFMQWTGLSPDQLWLRGRVAALGALRKDHPALRRGTRTSLSATDDTFVYSMSDGTETLYVAINRGDVDQSVSGLPAKTLQDVYNQNSVSGPSVVIPARSARVLSAP
jgi:glycosidase